MPTLKPRINVTLSPSLDSLVAQYAGLQRVSKSTVLRELLEAVEPSIRHVVALMVAAKGASADVRKNIVRDMENSAKAAESVSRQALQIAAGHTRDIVAEAEAIRGRRPARLPAQAGTRAGSARKALVRSKRRSDPPTSNRGVKS